jgi:hypothetical protein
MAAETRVVMLIEMRAVESGEAVGVVGEMAADPIEDDADARLVKASDERLEILRGAVAAGRRKQPRWLVSP